MLKSNVKSYHSLFIRFGFEILAKKKKEEKKKGQSHKMKKSWYALKILEIMDVYIMYERRA